MAQSIRKTSLALLAITALGCVSYAAFRGNSGLPLADPPAKGEATTELDHSVLASSSEAVAETPDPSSAEESVEGSISNADDAASDLSFSQLAAIAEAQKGDASISGIVVDKQGKPLSGMNIISGEMFATQLPPTATDAEGRFSASELVPGEYKLMAVPAVSGGYGIDSGHQKVTLNSGQFLTGIRLVYEGATHRTVSGKVTDAKGVPVSGARVDANDPAASVKFSSFTETGSDGRFVLEARERKRFDISISHPAYTTYHSARLEVGTNDLEIILQGRGTITGQVVDAATGKPVTSFEAGSGVRWHPTMLGVRSMASEKFVDPEGRFTLSSVEVGDVNVYVRAQGYAPQRIEVPEIRSDEVRDLGVVRLVGGASLEGVVTDMNGAPISQALILLGGTRDSAMGPPYFSTSRFLGEEYHAMTDDEGRFEIDTLSPELTEITLQHADHARTVGEIALVIGQRTKVQLVMTGFATVEGTVTVNGEPIERASVSVEHAALVSPLSAETDDQGRYQVKEVQEGEVVVHASFGSRVETTTATTALGHTTVVDLEIAYGAATFEGQVTTNGEPLKHISLAASSVSGDDSGSTTTTDEGMYQISGLLGGEYRIHVVDMNTQEPIVLGSARGTVAAGETITVDIECEE